LLSLNNNLQQLVGTAQKEEKLGIGLMSGTSLDGLDIALCRFKGHGMQTEFELVNFTTIPYTEDFKNEIRTIFAKRQVDLEKVCLLNAYIGTFHGSLVLQALRHWIVNPAAVDFIASHGQTIYHAPKRLHRQPGYPNATLQIGDGDHIAVDTGILTISDFRQKHIAGGGEGAPLALYGDVLLAGQHAENRILLNIGGIANLTFLPASGSDETILCTDIGPGNTLIDAACRKYFDRPFDKDSKIAFSGKLSQPLLDALSDNSFFREKAPKTTGPELFNLEYVEQARQISGTETISNVDLICTLSTFTARIIADFISENVAVDGTKIFASGGGARNIFVMEYLKKALPWTEIADTSALGINPDAKEAILFALLGNEALSGEPITIGDNPAVLMGKFSFSK
jgi:anhydro-N-acetylmuramic acid kinase